VRPGEKCAAFRSASQLLELSSVSCRAVLDRTRRRRSELLVIRGSNSSLACVRSGIGRLPSRFMSRRGSSGHARGCLRVLSIPITLPVILKMASLIRRGRSCSEAALHVRVGRVRIRRISSVNSLRASGSFLLRDQRPVRVGIARRPRRASDAESLFQVRDRRVRLAGRERPSSVVEVFSVRLLLWLPAPPRGGPARAHPGQLKRGAALLFAQSSNEKQADEATERTTPRESMCGTCDSLPRRGSQPKYTRCRFQLFHALIKGSTSLRQLLTCCGGIMHRREVFCLTDWELAYI